MEDDPPFYHYKPLTHNKHFIRIIKVLSTNSGELLCQFSEVPLDRHPAFTTLSYTWNAPFGTIPATFCHEDGACQWLLITPNLQAFLRQFVLNHPEPTTRPMLWVDAVCINQNDKQERNAQVSIMRDIYQEAQSVIIWLGAGSPESDSGMDFISQLVSAEHRAKTLPGGADFASGAQKQLFKTVGLPEYNADEYMAFVSLCTRDWFTRVWIIQEVALSTEAHITCGSRIASWDDFVKAFFFFNTLNLIIPDPARYTQTVVRVVGIVDAREARVLGLKRDFLGTLLRGRPALATNLRDKVFGLLGLATHAGPEALNYQPDYELSVQQVYTQLALAIINAEKNLDILGVPRSPRKSPVDILPSWVPDWSTWYMTSALSRRDRPATNVEDNETLIRNASGSTWVELKVNTDERMLGLEGYVFDQLLEVGVIYKSEDELLDYNIWLVDGMKFYKENTRALLQWEEISKAYSDKVYPPTGETILAAYWQTITAGWDVGEHDLSSENFRKWNSYHRPGASFRRLVGSSVTTSSAFAWLTFGLNICKQIIRPPPELGFDRPLTMASNRRFVRSRKGFIGLVPAETCVGDFVALFKGGRSPLIIRPEGDNWRLVGDSYMHGMMNAECFHESDCHTMWLV